jgi:ABC-type transporter MlaC component
MRYQEFVELFEDFVVCFYGHRLSADSGETLELGAAHVRAKDALVCSRVVDPKGPPLAVDWRLRRPNDRWRIVDVSSVT